jgi:uncharacterized secreted protein with C-terminal beta-propeller domain
MEPIRSPRGVEAGETEEGVMRARLVLLVATVLLFSSCVGSEPSGGGGDPVTIQTRLVSFSSCDEFLSYVRDRGVEHVTAWGLPGQAWGPWMRDGIGVVAMEDAAVGSGTAPAAVPGVDYSTTNLQTGGVDEPDIVKTDGERLVALAQGKLFVLDITGSAPVLLGSLTLGDVWVRDLVLSGDRALLFGEAAGGDVPVSDVGRSFPGGYGAPISALVEVDLSDPEQPRVERRLLVDGRYLSARMIDGVVRVVVSSYPTGLVFEGPTGPGLRAERDALLRNQEIVRASTIENWVPYYVLEDGSGGTLAEGSLLDCASANHPDEFSGFGMLTVLTLDLTEGLGGFVPDESVGVLSDGETVYASAGSLYVATQRWMDWAVLETLDAADREELTDGQVTQIHRFDISGPAGAEYRSSGEVPGWLLNQFSMDEHAGYLRVASTDAPPFWDGESESMVTVLAEDGGRLVEVGSVAGLGEDERIFAVRFLGDLGYVVTFRQVDPLYVIDLSDPTRPAVTGELKIQGYSAYLHPLGDDRLLGVGQDATSQGSLKGTQLSIFDVSDPTAPRRLDQVQIEAGSSEAEWDHHAFLYWEPEGLVVVPLNIYRWDEVAQTDETFFGAQAVRVSGGGLELLDRLTHDAGAVADWASGIRRSLVVGDLLFTVSETGVEAVDLTTLDDVAWVSFL